MKTIVREKYLEIINDIFCGVVSRVVVWRFVSRKAKQIQAFSLIGIKSACCLVLSYVVGW